MSDKIKANDMKIDVVIIGSGISGYSAALLLHTFGTKPLIIGKKCSHVANSPLIYNLPGVTKTMTGYEFYSILNSQVSDCKIDVIEEYVNSIKINDSNDSYESNGYRFRIELNSKNIMCKIILVATGLSYRIPCISGIDELIGKKVFGCLSCCDIIAINKQNHNPSNQINNNIIVIGGADSAFETALMLASVNVDDTKITILCRSKIKAKKMLVDQTLFEKNKNKIKIMENTEIKQIITNSDGSEIDYLYLNTGEKLYCDQIYCANGHIPSINFLKDLNIELDECGYIKTKHNSTETSIRNIFACGSVVTDKYLTTVATLGFGGMAATDILNRLSISSKL
jgi:thioredoxin reductase (NADPH)